MAIYYVRPTNGSDANGGLSHADAFQTFQKAADSVSAGDDIHLEPEATETTAVQVDWNTAQGTAASHIRVFIGNTTDGARDDSLRYTIQASASMTNLFNVASGFGDYVEIRGVIFDGNSNVTGDCVRWADTSLAARMVTCRFTGATGFGFTTAAVGGWLVACEADNNGGGGIGADASDGWNCTLCIAHDNTGVGFHLRDNLLNYYANAAIDNTSYGFYLDASDGVNFIGNIALQNDDHGVYILNSVERTVFFHNVMRNNGGYGLSNLNVTWEGVLIDYNCYSGNTGIAGSTATTLVTDANINDGTIGANNVTADPLFVSETDGAEDLTYQSGSPCLDVGLGNAIGSGVYPHLGSSTPAAGGGGGGLRLVGSGGLVG